jgi:hypothetical protein
MPPRELIRADSCGRQPSAAARAGHELRLNVGESSRTAFASVPVVTAANSRSVWSFRPPVG